MAPASAESSALDASGQLPSAYEQARVRNFVLQAIVHYGSPEHPQVEQDVMRMWQLTAPEARAAIAEGASESRADVVMTTRERDALETLESRDSVCPTNQCLLH